MGFDIKHTSALHIRTDTKAQSQAFIMETGSIWYAIRGPHRVTRFIAAEYDSDEEK